MINKHHLKIATRFLAHRFKELHPYEVVACLTYACNLRCAYCRCSEIEKELMTSDQWRKIINCLASSGAIRIKFQGGEPTLRQDFRELGAEARSLGLITAVVTNGLMISSHPALLDHLDEIVVSLDSVSPDIHDRTRGRNTHSRAVRAIDIARDRGLGTYVVMTVNRDNISELEAMLDFCEARRIKMHAQPVIFGPEYTDSNARHLALTSEQIRLLHIQLAHWKSQGRQLIFSTAAYRRAALWPDATVITTPSTGDSLCVAGKGHVHIEPNGDVMPCANYEGSFVPKNILQHGFYNAMRHVQKHDCGDCWLVYLNERKALYRFRPSSLLQIGRYI